jgi:signal transduction histidine kinase
MVSAADFTGKTAVANSGLLDGRCLGCILLPVLALIGGARMPDRTDVLIWASGPGAVPSELTDALESQGIQPGIHLGDTIPSDHSLVVVRWCDSFASNEFATAIDMLARGTATSVVVVANGLPALTPDALRPGLYLVDGVASPRALATSIATALVGARDVASQKEERARLSDVADAQENLVAIASHDLRTPVSTLRLVHDLFRSGLSAATLPRSSSKIDIDELLDILERNLDKMEAFINDILEASRLYRGRTDVKFDAVSLNSVIDDTIAGMFPIAIRKDIGLDFVKDKDIPAIKGETTRVSQVVANLIGNALKYTPAGGTVSVYTRLRDGGAELEVADNGPGITEGDRGKVFRRFSRGSAKATGGEPSTGLGLFICREIVDLYGGGIWFESKPGAGSTFFVFWPSADSLGDSGVAKTGKH